MEEKRYLVDGLPDDTILMDETSSFMTSRRWALQMENEGDPRLLRQQLTARFPATRERFSSLFASRWAEQSDLGFLRILKEKTF